MNQSGCQATCTNNSQYFYYKWLLFLLKNNKQEALFFSCDTICIHNRDLFFHNRTNNYNSSNSFLFCTPLNTPKNIMQGDGLEDVERTPHSLFRKKAGEKCRLCRLQQLSPSALRALASERTHAGGRARTVERTKRPDNSYSFLNSEMRLLAHALCFSKVFSRTFCLPKGALSLVGLTTPQPLLFCQTTLFERYK